MPYLGVTMYHPLWYHLALPRFCAMVHFTCETLLLRSQASPPHPSLTNLNNYHVWCSSVSAQVFKSEVGPDGNARDELDVACTIDHPNLTKSLGIVRASNAKSGGGGGDGGSGGDVVGGGGVGGGDGVDNFLWLVMERVVGKPLAEKPDFSSVLRCRWGSGRRFEPVLVLAVLLQVGGARLAV